MMDTLDSSEPLDWLWLFSLAWNSLAVLSGLEFSLEVGLIYHLVAMKLA